MKTKTGITLKFGDKVLNQYASERNPHRIGVVIKISSQFIFLTDMEKDYWQLPNDRHLKIEVVGSIFSTLKSAKEEVQSPEEIPLVLNDKEKQELKLLKDAQNDHNVFMSNERYERLQELAKREFGFNMGPENKYGNLFLLPDGKVIQGGLNASQYQSVQSNENTATCDNDFKCKDNSYFPKCGDCVYLNEHPVQSVKGEGERTAVKKIITMPLECGHLYNLCKTCHNPHNYGKPCDSETKFPLNCPLESYKHPESKEQYPADFLLWIGGQGLYYDKEEKKWFEVGEGGVVYKKSTDELFNHWSTVINNKI